MAKASKTIKGAKAVLSLRDGVPDGISEGDVCIIMSPTARQDYVAAQSIASSNPVVVVNGLAKVRPENTRTSTSQHILLDLTQLYFFAWSFGVPIGPKKCTRTGDHGLFLEAPDLQLTAGGVSRTQLPEGLDDDRSGNERMPIDLFGFTNSLWQHEYTRPARSWETSTESGGRSRHSSQAKMRLRYCQIRTDKSIFCA